MFNIEDMNPREAVFTHIDDVTGIQIDVAIDRLNAHIRARCIKGLFDPVPINVEHHIAEYFINNRGIEPHRLKRIRSEDFLNPILFATTPKGTHLLLDGHHRYVAAAMAGKATLPAFVVPERVWRKFLIEGMGQATTEILRNMYSGM